MHHEVPDRWRQLLPDHGRDLVRGLEVLEVIVVHVPRVSVVVLVGDGGAGGHLALAAGVQHVVHGEFEAGAEIAKEKSCNAGLFYFLY